MVKTVDYDKQYPIRITDGWGGKLCLTIEGAKEIIRDLQEVVSQLEEEKERTEEEEEEE